MVDMEGCCRMFVEVYQVCALESVRRRTMTEALTLQPCMA